MEDEPSTADNRMMMTNRSLMSSTCLVLSLVTTAIATRAGVLFAGEAVCEHRLEVRILNPQGAPISHARVRFAWDSPPEGTPMLGADGAMTMTGGSFWLPQDSDASPFVCDDCCDSIGTYRVSVEADGYATTEVTGLGPDSLLIVRVQSGAAVQGRVVKDGKIVAGARVSIIGGPEALTSSDGVYLFEHLATDSSYFLYTPMDHGRSAGAVHSIQVETGPDLSVTSARDIVAGRVHSLRGRLVPPEGVALEPRFILFWLRTIQSETGGNAYDEIPYLHVDADGRFEIMGLPEQTIRLRLGRSSWSFASNPPIPFHVSSNGRELSWNVRRDLTGVRIPLRYEAPSSKTALPQVSP